MKGIVLSGGSGTRLYPMTRAANKQLLPVYNKPMVYYPLTTLMLADCREILLVVNPQDEESYRRLFGDGRQWGLEISYAVQPRPGGIAEVFIIGRDFVGKDRVGLILGDNLFYGDSLPAVAERGAKGKGAVIYAYWVSDPGAYGVVEFDAADKPVLDALAKRFYDPADAILVVGGPSSKVRPMIEKLGLAAPELRDAEGHRLAP